MLVTGGAGYIGSHVVRILREQGRSVVVVDDLSTGRAQRVRGVPIVQLDLAGPGARTRLEALIETHDVRAVLHFAAMKEVARSVAEPTSCFDQNVGGLLNLLAAMETTGCRDLVFSSSAAVYGDVRGSAVTEDAPRRPVNPYGQSKLVGEWMTENAAAARRMRVANLRYFNVAGAGSADLADDGATNLVPIVIDAVRHGRPVTVFGTDWGTPDGTCVRDYIHVQDLARAHVCALDALAEAGPGVTAYNLGTGSGSSVLDVVRAVERTSGRAALVEPSARRPGDPAAVVADPARAARELHWRAEFDLSAIVESAWRARAALQLTP